MDPITTINNDMDSLLTTINNIGLPLKMDYPTPGRGNCFFAAMVQQFANRPELELAGVYTEATLCRSVCEFALTSADYTVIEFSDRYDLVAITEGKKTWTMFFTDMKKSGVWAEGPVARCAAWMLETDLLIVTARCTNKNKFLTLSGALKASSNDQRIKPPIIYCDRCSLPLCKKCSAGVSSVLPPPNTPPGTPLSCSTPKKSTHDIGELSCSKPTKSTHDFGEQVKNKRGKTMQNVQQREKEMQNMVSSAWKDTMADLECLMRELRLQHAAVAQSVHSQEITKLKEEIKNGNEKIESLARDNRRLNAAAAKLKYKQEHSASEISDSNL